MRRFTRLVLILPPAAVVMPWLMYSVARPPPDGQQLFPAEAIPLGYLSYMVACDDDDGTEVCQASWHGDGYAGGGHNRMGIAAITSYDIGLRFHLPDVRRRDTFAYARLALPATAEGQVNAGVDVRIVGIDSDGVAPFSNDTRPSQLPKTQARTAWCHETEWTAAAGASDCNPLVRYSPNIAGVINEIVARPDWGTSEEGKTIGLVINNYTPPSMNYMTVRDYHEVDHPGCPGTVVAPVLELYRDVRSTFLGRELLGCPTDHGVKVNAHSLLDLEMFVEYGTTPGVYTHQTPVVARPGGTPYEVTLDSLASNTCYYYRLRYRQPDESEFNSGPQHSFRTQRDVDDTFVFAVQADSEIHDSIRARDGDAVALYCVTLGNIAADQPDFLVDLGDTFHCESYAGRDVLDFQEAVERHLDQRRFFDLVCHSTPFFLVLGNHEGEQGWRLDGTAENVAVWATNARKLIYPLPAPDDFYSGNETAHPWTNLRENYYAWEWGNALFVMLDPFWYTAQKPHEWPEGEPGTGDNWDWTLGQTQYEWLRDTLGNSSVDFKFVFVHHLTGGVNTYGRGGIEAASHELGQTGSFEWGGEDTDGKDAFAHERPGWGVPIHDLLVDGNVTILFHAHDHVFVKQDLDGVVYQECPKPSDATYGTGHTVSGHYYNGDIVNNSGHLRITVSLSAVTVEYVRAYLPGDGENGEVGYVYTLYPSAGGTN